MHLPWSLPEVSQKRNQKNNLLNSTGKGLGIAFIDMAIKLCFKPKKKYLT
jgi:hypothetical protein